MSHIVLIITSLIVAFSLLLQFQYKRINKLSSNFIFNFTVSDYSYSFISVLKIVKMKANLLVFLSSLAFIQLTKSQHQPLQHQIPQNLIPISMKIYFNCIL